jgi:hypothetical protein
MSFLDYTSTSLLCPFVYRPDHYSFRQLPDTSSILYALKIQKRHRYASQYLEYVPKCPKMCLHVNVYHASMYKEVSMLSANSAAGYNDEMDTDAKDAVCSTGTAGVEGIRVP